MLEAGGRSWVKSTLVLEKSGLWPRCMTEVPSYRGQFKRPPVDYWSRWREECAIADRIVVNSSWSYDALLAEGVPPTKIRVVPLAYEEPKPAARFRREYPVEIYFVATLARIVPRTNQSAQGSWPTA